MSRVLRAGLVGLVVMGLGSISYGQCGGTCHVPGSYSPQYRAYSPVHSGCTSGGYAQQNYYGPQFPRYSAPTYYKGDGFGGGASIAPPQMYFAPQGSGSRSFAPGPSSYPQPTYQPAPGYSAPQGSGARSYPSQGSGSR